MGDPKKPAATPRRFAQETKADPFKTLGEIDRLLTKAGASDLLTFRRSAREGVAFVRDGIAYKVSVYVPATDEDARPFLRRGSLAGHESPRDAERARRLRVLLRAVQTKVMGVDEEVYSFEEAFGQDIVVNAGTGETVGEWAAREAKAAAIAGRVASSLPMPGEGGR